VLDALQARPPESWQQLVELSEQLAQAGKLTDPDGGMLPTGVALPVSRGWAARSLLAISAASIRQPGKLDTLFDRRDMKPMIDQQPFQRALQQLERLAGNTKQMSPSDVVRSFFAGQLAVAVCWPSRAFLDDELIDDGNAEALMAIQDHVLVTRLPGVTETYDLQNQQWQPTGAGISRVELIGFDCRLASVLKSTTHPTDAFKFLAWLSSKQTVASVFSAASFGSPTRAGHLGDPLLWTGDVLDQTTADQYADLLLRINEEPVFLTFPRIEASERYWSTLEDAVQKFLAGEIDAADALQNAAADWERITDECGRDRQIELLRKDQTF
jgi:multiple sugar transport system substrate-binding protein